MRFVCRKGYLRTRRAQCVISRLLSVAGFTSTSHLKKKIENKYEAKPVQSFTEREKKKINSIMSHDVKP